MQLWSLKLGKRSQIVRSKASTLHATVNRFQEAVKQKIIFRLLNKKERQKAKLIMNLNRDFVLLFQALCDEHEKLEGRILLRNLLFATNGLAMLELPRRYQRRLQIKYKCDTHVLPFLRSTIINQLF